MRKFWSRSLGNGVAPPVSPSRASAASSASLAVKRGMVSEEIATAARGSPRGSRTRRAFGVCRCREQLSKVAKCLEREGIAARVVEEHGRFFSHPALEPSAGLDDEFPPEAGEPVGECGPLRGPQHDAAMWHGHAVAVHRVE